MRSGEPFLGRVTGGRVSTLIDGVPACLIEAYAERVTRHGIAEEVDPGVWVASVVGFDGAWAEGGTADEALAALPESIAGWVVAKRRAGATVPLIEGLDLSRLTAQRGAT